MFITAFSIFTFPAQPQPLEKAAFLYNLHCSAAAGDFLLGGLAEPVSAYLQALGKHAGTEDFHHTVQTVNQTLTGELLDADGAAFTEPFEL
jgi:hypothetical protein